MRSSETSARALARNSGDGRLLKEVSLLEILNNKAILSRIKRQQVGYPATIYFVAYDGTRVTVML